MLNLSQPIPQEGSIGIDLITNLMQKFSQKNFHNSSITTDLIPEEYLPNVIKKAQESAEEYGTYIVEHSGHFILLDLTQTESGVEYAIFDSLYHNSGAQERKELIEDILKNTFPNAVISCNENKYIKIEQGKDIAIMDADNCGLTSVFAQYIYEKYNAKFPNDIFVDDKELYYQINSIAQELRGQKEIDIDEILRKLTFLTSEIVDLKEKSKRVNQGRAEDQEKKMPNKEFDIYQGIEDISVISDKYADEKELEMLFELTPKFEDFLRQVHQNQSKVDEINANLIAEIYKSTIEIFFKHREALLLSIKDKFFKIIANEPYDHEKLTQEIQFAKNFINTLHVFYKLKELFSDKFNEKNIFLLNPQENYDPVLNISQLVIDITSREKEAVGDKIGTIITSGFFKAIELAINLAKENEECYQASGREELKLLISHLNNCLFYYKATQYIQEQRDVTSSKRKELAEIFANYAINAGSEKNDHNIIGFLTDYAINNNSESLKKFGSVLANFEDEEKKLQFLQLAIEILSKEASSPIEEKLRLSRFLVIYQLLTKEGFSKFVKEDINLEFALLFAKQNLFTKNQEKKYQVCEEELSSINPDFLSGAYPDLYLSSISFTQNLDLSKSVFLSYLDKGISEYRPTQEDIDFRNLQAAFGFRNHLTYNEACPQHCYKDKSLASSIEIHKKTIKKTQTPRIKLSLLNSLFKLQYLSADNDGSEDTIRQIAIIIREHSDLAKEIPLKIYLEYINKPQDELDIEDRLRLIEKLDPYINEFEIQTIIQSNNNLIARQQKDLFQSSARKTSKPQAQKTEYVLKIDGIQVDLHSLQSINHEGEIYKIFCPESIIDKAGDFKKNFKEALQKNEFAKAFGSDGVKYIGKTTNGKVYEVKIKQGEPRILGIEKEFLDQDKQKVRIIYFSKFLLTTKNAKKRTNTAYNAAKNSLKLPDISYEEKDPSVNPSQPKLPEVGAASSSLTR